MVAIIGAVSLNPFCVKSEHERLLKGEIFGLPFVIPLTERYEEIQGIKLMISSSCHHALIKLNKKIFKLRKKKLSCTYPFVCSRAHERANCVVAIVASGYIREFNLRLCVLK